MMAQLPTTSHLKIAHETIAAIDMAVERGAEAETRRGYLGGSVIGKPCERALWYEFRMAHDKEKFSGRMLRLFDTGHVEEARMIRWLRMSGATVHDVDPSRDEQWAVEAVSGHMRGHLDGIVTGIREAPKTPHLLECKTHNAKSFAQLVKHGVAVAKPVHMAQMQVYMHLKGLTRALYLAKNKDTDELYAERLDYDQAHALTLIAKAERIINASSAPPRISDDPDWFQCRFCPAWSMCHGDKFAGRNCRTCIHAHPFEGGKWACLRHDRSLSDDDQRNGCPNHLYLPSLVPGEQIDADETAETITYQMSDGSQWTDGRAEART